jgi:AcrR family transcriptional regulator
LTEEALKLIITSVIVFGGAMSKKPVTTREEMIEKAFQLVRREGFLALTARKLAEELGCSTQPVMYQFPDLNTLKDEVYLRADKYHSEYLNRDDDFLEIGLRYIQFANEEPHLFRFLFQSGRFDGSSIRQLTHEAVDGSIVEAASRELEMNREETLDAFEVLFAMVHGYASLIANNAMEYDPEALRTALTRVAEGLVGN